MVESLSLKLGVLGVKFPNVQCRIRENFHRRKKFSQKKCLIGKRLTLDFGPAFIWFASWSFSRFLLSRFLLSRPLLSRLGTALSTRRTLTPVRGSVISRSGVATTGS